MPQPQEQVYARFQPIFSSSYIPRLSEEEFRPFLYFENNHHWTGLHRQVNRLCANMPALRTALQTLNDESRPIDQRLDEIAAGSVIGLGKGTLTAILHVTYPEKYGVWNNTSEGALQQLGIYPEFERGASYGTRYLRINELLKRLAQELGINLWTLDALWWMVTRGKDLPVSVRNLATENAPPPFGNGVAIATLAPSTAAQYFGLERHLHNFLFDNWDQLDIGRDWAIYSEAGDDEAGYEYTCPVGRIDMLARHRRERKWLVVELKREDTSDSVVGQVLRYMGWVRQHLAEPGDEVQGLIVARVPDAALQYAISLVPMLSFQVYEVEFRLKDPPPLPSRSR